MELTCRDIGAVRVLSVEGRIDHARAADFQQALAPHLDDCNAQGEALVLDFGAVDYVSSIGLRALMLAAKQVKAQNGRIAIAALSPVVSEVFQISRFNLVFNVYDSVEAAAAELTK
jgi:anti-sigma B factor antagonist